MNLAPLWESHWIIVAHAITAIAAIILGGVQLLMRKGTLTHKLLGRLWVALMAIVAISSFWIHEFRLLGLFSPIHLLSLLVLYSLWEGVHYARVGNIAKHKKTMHVLYVLALLITGAFTLLPGRVFYKVIFGA